MDARVGAALLGVPNRRPRPRSRRRGRSLLVGCLLAATVLFALSAAAGAAPGVEDEEEEDAKPRYGEVASVEQLLVQIRQRFDGRVLKVELDQEWRRDGRIWVYEAKLLTQAGEVLKLEYDARSLELIEVQRPKPKAVEPDGGD